MGTRNAIAIDLTRRRVRAVQASAPRRGRLRIQRVLVEDVPVDLNFDDAAVVGEWLAQRLHAAGIARGQATLSVGREHVGLKRITLPTTDAAELPEMTRLAMQRELPFDAESAVIDYVVVERGMTGTTVLAVAVPRTQIEFLRDVIRAAGFGVRRIALRTMGAAALVDGLTPPSGVSIEDVGQGKAPSPSATLDQKDDGAGTGSAILAVDVVGEGVEFCVVSGGANTSSIRFSRAAEVPAPQDELAMAEAVVTEARRTWMSYRVGEESGGIGAAVIMGDRRVAEYVAGPLGEMLRLQVRVLREHPRIDSGDRDLSRVWPLAGLLIEDAMASERIDFLHPRKAPDLGARTRLRWLLAAAAVILVAGVAFTFMRMDLKNLKRDAADLVTQTQDGAPANARYGRDLYKIEHLRRWSGVHVDWLDHAAFLAKVAPPPDQIVLDSWSGAIDFRGVTFAVRDKKELWAANHQTTIVIEGEARDRSTADGFRDALTQSPIYVASTTGADTRGGKRMPFGFTYRLRTRAEAPPLESVGGAGGPGGDESAKKQASKADKAQSEVVDSASEAHSAARADADEPHDDKVQPAQK